ncbi:GIY-YIG nuclease family protein [archaeon]|jgi:putative endonuclease|nr:GIY-YIG nuclease family protein [archaeon]MBT3450816.1 GIY-YIG nuclease family protein [archaeon]MBT6868475.1 GIY-YIG nuclease family protein [archaeon]MBT7193574.1 GIY-YIG nuclease family protein [archaeon]MBT7381231.1 GIY-YIG nuclease family protein [archaeon]
MNQDKWYVYILECKDESLYTGITNNIQKRMEAHKNGKGSKYVKWKKFDRLLHSIKVSDKSEAAKLEYKIKQLDRNDKITFFMKHPNLIVKSSNNNI